MQMGHMRFEPNINVHISDASDQVHKTAITEIKNLNSFNVLEKATAYEIQRQIHDLAVVDNGALGGVLSPQERGFAHDAHLDGRVPEVGAQLYVRNRGHPDPRVFEVADDDLTDLLTQLCSDAFNSMSAHGFIV